MILSYRIADVRPYINWLYFYHAWGLAGGRQAVFPDGQTTLDVERESLWNDAQRLLNDLDGSLQTQALFVLHEAYGDGDDIVLMRGDEELARLPMLRQQTSAPPQLCLADFLMPRGKRTGEPGERVGDAFRHVGLFAATVPSTFIDAAADDYSRMLAQTLADRLAEATVELLHKEVRRHYWGYAPDELPLSVADLHREAFQGIRPAVGYPSLPDMSLNFLLDELLDMQQIGIRLTESGMMRPHASVSGLMFAHPQARYFDVGRIGEDQLADYARRRLLAVADLRRFLRVAEVKKDES